MTKHDLKELAAMGAELGAAKADNDRLREVLSRIANLPMYQCSTENDYRLSAAKAMAVAALTQQAEPTATYTAVDMATAAAQGFRDGQAAVEPAPAQDELWAVHAQGPDELYAAFGRDDAEQHAAALNALPMPAGIQVSATVIASPWSAAEHWKYLAEQEREHAAELKARAAQTEQQPVATIDSEAWLQEWARGKFTYTGAYKPRVLGQLYGNTDWALARALHSAIVSQLAAPIAQTAPQPEQSGKFAMHQRVRKTSGSEWHGRICGTYSTSLTPEGYAVESEAHAGSVQIYPAKALEAVE